jgi:ParB-like nuclease domain
VLKLWNKAKNAQLDLLDAAPVPAATPALAAAASHVATTQRVEPAAPQMLAIGTLCKDPNNPRTEFPEGELEELAENIRQHGVLQPIVVHPGQRARSARHSLRRKALACGSTCGAD